MRRAAFRWKPIIFTNGKGRINLSRHGGERGSGIVNPAENGHPFTDREQMAAFSVAPYRLPLDGYTAVYSGGRVWIRFQAKGIYFENHPVRLLKPGYTRISLVLVYINMVLCYNYHKSAVLHAYFAARKGRGDGFRAGL
ncbi:MAG: hypothetical protein PHE09_13925 [Oscillospiraceae bacterium]|nr:hypothetical protein [Oscillospiraceae bacterium]